MKTIQAVAKPFIKWVGGKGQLISQLEELLPADFDKWENVTYIEPFVGGGAMLFYMLQAHSNIRSAVINDINSDLTTCYKVVRDHPSDLVEALKEVQKEYYSLQTEDVRKDFYLRMRDEFNTKQLDHIRNTTLFIFLNRTCFNGLYRVNKAGLFNVPFGRYETPTICDPITIYADSKLLQNVEILTGDYQQTLGPAKGNTLFYFDPPYRPLSNTSSFNDYAKEAFNDAAQVRLRDFCNQVTKAGFKFMLSNSNTKDMFFDDLYLQYQIERVWASRMVNANPNKRGKLTELIIRNYGDQNFELTAEQLFLIPEYQQLIHEQIGEPTDHYYLTKVNKDYARTSNYHDGVYYHATGGLGEMGVGKGLYLGKDSRALNNFYNCDGEYGEIIQFVGAPRFLDLTLPSALDDFEIEAIQEFGKDPNREYLKKKTIAMGYDGIRYYDFSATGEEFVLFNTYKVQPIKTLSYDK